MAIEFVMTKAINVGVQKIRTLFKKKLTFILSSCLHPKVNFFLWKHVPLETIQPGKSDLDILFGFRDIRSVTFEV